MIWLGFIRMEFNGVQFLCVAVELLTPGAVREQKVFSRRSETSFTKHTHQGRLEHTHAHTRAFPPPRHLWPRSSHYPMGIIILQWMAFSLSLVLLFTRSHCLLSSFSCRRGGRGDSGGGWWRETGGGPLVTCGPGESSHPGADQPALLSCSAWHMPSSSIRKTKQWHNIRNMYSIDISLRSCQEPLVTQRSLATKVKTSAQAQ